MSNVTGLCRDSVNKWTWSQRCFITGEGKLKSDAVAWLLHHVLLCHFQVEGNGCVKALIVTKTIAFKIRIKVLTTERGSVCFLTVTYTCCVFLGGNYLAPVVRVLILNAVINIIICSRIYFVLFIEPQLVLTCRWFSIAAAGFNRLASS